MQRRIFFKDINQKLTGNHRIQRNAGPLILVQRRLLLYDNQCAGLYLGHLKDCFYQLIDRLVTESGLRLLRTIEVEHRADDILASQLLQRLSKLRLEYNHQSGNSQAEDVLTQPQDRIQAESPCHEDENQKHCKALQKHPGPGLLDPHHDFIQQKRQYNHIQQIIPVDGIKGYILIDEVPD